MSMLPWLITTTIASRLTTTSTKDSSSQKNCAPAAHLYSKRYARRMPQTIRYHLDEHCPEALAEGLRLHGIDVTTSVEADLLSSTDEEQLAYSLAQGRMLFTQDEDFLRLHV